MKELIISNLSKTYSSGVQALKNIDLTIRTGMFGLLGPNGAGKSTLMRTIATLQDPDSGSITYNGMDIIKEKHELRKVLGLLPQEFDFYPRITAWEMMMHFAALKGIRSARDRKEAVEQFLKIVNLYSDKSRKIGGFSGGMKQRLGIAQALLGNPEIIIVDEPTAGLDPKERHHFHNILSEIGQEKIVILSTHIVDDVSELCSSMAIINKGEVKMTSNPLGAIEHIKGKIWRKLIEKNTIDQYRELNIISNRLFTGKLMIHIISETDPGNDFSPVDPNLEDVYFSTIPHNEVI
ncbi:MAG: ABC transporter ATP-binding protein [Candidatus Cloacimonetes bacterium]|nr:ABC transporter ATP-binding protein [Candidatus Cloacimonadota bacterium]